jgi:hypothetical protein
MTHNLFLLPRQHTEAIIGRLRGMIDHMDTIGSTIRLTPLKTHVSGSDSPYYRSLRRRLSQPHYGCYPMLSPLDPLTYRIPVSYSGAKQMAHH